MKSLSGIALALALGGQLPPALAQAVDIVALLAPCATCHGLDGIGQTGDVPHLDQQDVRYLTESIYLLAEGKRATAVAGHVPAIWTPPEVRAAAAHFSRTKGTRQIEATDPTKAARGREVFLEKCESCHEDGGRATDYRGTGSPKLAGQRIGYLDAQIRAYLSGQRSYLVDMKKRAFLGLGPGLRGVQKREQLAPAVSSDDAEAVAHFLASNQPR